jgi:hypothetical protein
MTAKNVNAKFWSPMVRSFDGQWYLAYPNGDKPSGFQSAPTLVLRDVRCISLTGHEFGLGGYIRVHGYSLGTQANLGTPAGCRVYLRDPIGDNLWHEVANYRFLRRSVTYPRTQLVEVGVQVGALGGSQTAGRALDMKAVVDGVSSNVMTAAMVIQPGDAYFAALTGDEATGVKNDITQPFRYLQYWQSALPTGMWLAGGVQGGDTIVLRAGNWTDQTGFDNRWLRWWRPTVGASDGVIGGSAPTGVVGHGHIHITAYPGPILGHAPEYVHHTGATGGGIQGCDTARAELGYGKYTTISGLHIEVGANAIRDSCPINFQNGADHWYVTGNELGPWPSALVPPDSSKGAGVAGQSHFFGINGNHIHDIDCDATNNDLSDPSPDSPLENHGIYIGGATGGSAYDEASNNGDVSYNWIHDIQGGSGIQFYWQGSADTSVFEDNDVHHNFVENTRKYGINMAHSNVSGRVWNNICVNTGLNSLRFEGGGYSAGVNTFDMHFAFNTSYGWNNRGSPSDAGFITEGYANTGVIDVTHNIFCGLAGRTTTTSYYANTVFTGADANITLTQNVYFDPDGVAASPPSKDTAPVYGNPVFRKPAGKDFTCDSTGAGFDAVTTTPAVAATDDFYGIARPQGGRKDCGACEGVFT